MIFHKVEHQPRQPLLRLPDGSDVRGSALTLQDPHEGVVETDLVVEVIQPGIQILPVAPRLVDLADKEQLREVWTKLPDNPSPEGDRHHLRHIAAEAVHTEHGPVVEDVVHLGPGVRNRLLEVCLTGIGINTIIELHSVVPVVPSGLSVEDIVARRPCGILRVGGWLRSVV